jgi:DNA-binding transcriptional MerR regulator
MCSLVKVDMDELDIEKIKDFGFSFEQCSEFLKNYQKSTRDDCRDIKVLWHDKNIEQLLLKLHAFKGMVGLFAKTTMIDFVTQLEQEVRKSESHSSELVSKQFEVLYCKCENLQKEVKAYLDECA